MIGLNIWIKTLGLRKSFSNWKYKGLNQAEMKQKINTNRIRFNKFLFDSKFTQFDFHFIIEFGVNNIILLIEY